MDVYFLSPQVRRDEFPLGGHFRMKLAPNGKLLASRKFTNACLSMPASPQNRVLGVAHLLDPVQTEMHVFTALSARIPVMVTIGDRRWHVDDRSITLVEAGRNNGRRGR